MSKERILVTGARGFIGAKTVDVFSKIGEQVKSFEGDITKSSDWENNLIGDEIIFLIAGVRTETQEDYKVNAYSIERLIEVAARTNKLPRKIVLVSSQAVYMGNEIPFRESQNALPTTVYGKSKLLGEALALSFCEDHDIPLVVLRYSTVLGEGIRPGSNMSGPLLIWTNAALAGETLKVFQDGNQTRDYIHVNDVSRANVLAIDLPPGVYNVGGGAAVKLIELVNWVREISNSDSEIVILGGEPSPSDPRDMLSDTSKIQKYGWAVLENPKEAVKEFVSVKRPC